MTAPLIYEQDGPVVTLTLNRPELHNPITDGDMIEALVEKCSWINRDSGISAVILTGAGTSFCSGGNMAKMRDREGMFAGPPDELREGYRRGVQKLARAVHGLEAPSIAAVNGPAIGAGLDLALMCDIRLCSADALFAESFVRVGIVPGDGGAWLLPRAIGQARAALMTLTGDKIDARTALEWGLVCEVAEDDLMERARALAARVAKNPPRALRMAKLLLRESPTQTFSGMLELSAALQAIAHQTDDHAEGVNAFFEKRPPIFRGG